MWNFTTRLGGRLPSEPMISASPNANGSICRERIPVFDGDEGAELKSDLLGEDGFEVGSAIGFRT